MVSVGFGVGVGLGEDKNGPTKVRLVEDEFVPIIAAEGEGEGLDGNVNDFFDAEAEVFDDTLVEEPQVLDDTTPAIDKHMVAGDPK